MAFEDIYVDAEIVREEKDGNIVIYRISQLAVHYDGAVYGFEEERWIGPHPRHPRFKESGLLLRPEFQTMSKTTQHYLRLADANDVNYYQLLTRIMTNAA